MTITLEDAMDGLAALFAPKHGDPEYHRPRVTDYRMHVAEFDAGRVKPSDVLGRNCRDVYTDPKKTAREWLYKQVVTELAMSQYEAPPVEPGQNVITWHTAAEDSIRWIGVDPSDPDLSMIRLNIGMRDKTVGSHLTCPRADVAPTWMPLPDAADERIDIQKATKPGPWVAGPWRLHVPIGTGSARPHEKWFRTRAEATRYGRVWLAVLDFHLAVSEGVTDPWEEHRIANNTHLNYRRFPDKPVASSLTGDTK